MPNLRNYQTGDEPAIMNVLAVALGKYGLKTDPTGTDADIIDIQTSYIENHGAFKVLVDNQKIIGSYGLFFVSTTTCELRKMYLLPEYQGQGLGKLLLEDALKTAKTMNFEIMVLETNRLLIEAIGLYQKYGFKVYQPDHLSKRCDLAMQKKL